MKHKKGLTIEECVRRAKKFIDSQGVCLLLYDIKGSRNFEVNKFIQKRREMQESLNNKFIVRRTSVISRLEKLRLQPSIIKLLEAPCFPK